MSMGTCITVHYVVEDKVVNKVLGKIAKEHIKSIKDFLKMQEVKDENVSFETFVNDELDWSNNENGEGLFDDDSDYSDGVKAAFQNLLKQKQEIQQKFHELTGMSLYLVYNSPDDTYDDVDGFAWAINFRSLFQRTPEYNAFTKKYKAEASWSQVVKFG